MRRLGWAWLVVAGVCLPTLARAEPGGAAQLSYARSEHASGCPDRTALRAAVSRRLGYDPFLGAARQTIIVEIATEQSELVGRVRLVDAEGVVRGARDLRTRANECPELVASLALAISITLDPAAALEREGQAELEATPAAPPIETEPARAAAPKPIEPPEKPVAPAAAKVAPTTGEATGHDRFSLSVRAGALGSFGSAPSLAFGLWAGVGVERSRFELLAELRGDFEASKPADSGGSVGSSLLVGNLALCRGFGWCAACALLSLGRLDARGTDVSSSRDAHAFHAAAGARYEVRIRLSEAVALLIGTDLTVNLTPVSFYLDSAEAWSSPPLAAALSAGLNLDLP